MKDVSAGRLEFYCVRTEATLPTKTSLHYHDFHQAQRLFDTWRPQEASEWTTTFMMYLVNERPGGERLTALLRLNDSLFYRITGQIPPSISACQAWNRVTHR